MEKNNILLFLLCCLLSVAYVSKTHSKPVGQKQANDWCIAQANAPSDKLQAFINYACGVVDCTAIQPGGTCFDPNTIVSHASYALNLVYKNGGTCNLDVITSTTFMPTLDDTR
ncbi:hypothetical protein DH2020_003133 [Rehmannia glutinosa]|uniref:X8 domain-containing protein n=1 Tax=Rehmannia glutinosa TaxID=99300 RepID=A0ABR0XKR3_REHGL